MSIMNLNHHKSKDLKKFLWIITQQHNQCIKINHKNYSQKYIKIQAFKRIN